MSKALKPRRPDWKVRITDKANKKERTIAGAAWNNEYGQISIHLLPGIVLSWQLNQTCYITLVPYEDTEERTAKPPAPSDGDGDVPIS